MDILMPRLGETVLEGAVVAWRKSVGDAVKKGEALVDVETDKTAAELEAPDSGVLSSIVVSEGETVEVGTLLAVLTVEGEIVEASEAVPEVQEETAASVGARQASGGFAGKAAVGKLSPVVRRLLREQGLDAAHIAGTGRDGRVTRRDVLAYMGSLASGGAAKPEPGATPSSAAGAAETKGRIPFNRIRRVTAQHMVQSKAMSPHVLQTIEVDFSAVDRTRLARRDHWKAEKNYSLSYLPFVARALCNAIREYPRVNSSVDGDALVVHDRINVAIAVDLNFDGLVAPVVRDAGNLNVAGLADAFNAVIGKAKLAKLTADDLNGGTYTISNPGPFGTFFTAPIINQPQVAIMSMDTVKKRPVVVQHGDEDIVVIRPVGVLAQSFDHRAFDGAYSAAFLNHVKVLIEETDWEKEL